MATTLAPLPQPGFTIFQGFTATKPESFLAKDLDTFGNRSSCSILFCSPEGEPGAQFLEIVEGPKNYISFRITNGQEVMRILKKASAWQFKTNEYTGLRVDGTEVWHLKLKKGWLGSDYELTVIDKAVASSTIAVQDKVMGGDKGIVVNGQPAMTTSQHEKWKHMNRQDLIHVVPGMDILLSLGVIWIKADKAAQDTKVAVIGGAA